MIDEVKNFVRIQGLSVAGRHQECLQACQQLLQGEPENPLPWKHAGKSLLALGQFAEAQQYLAKAHQLDSNDPETTKDIGNTYLKLGSTDTAAVWYKKSIEINNNYAPAINNLANLKRHTGKIQDAIDLYKRAIQADSQLTQAYLGAAASLLSLGDLDQAEVVATQAIEINASIPGINEILGVVLQNKKNFQQALIRYQKELTINPKSITSLLNLGLLLLQQGEAAAAIEPLSAAAAINPSAQCSLLLAQAYQKNGQLKEAIVGYKSLDLSKTRNKMIPFNLGLCYLNTGNNIDAIEAFKIAIKLDEAFIPAWGNIGTALIHEGRHQEALSVTQKVLQLDPNNPDALLNLGGIYQDLGNLDQALASTFKSLEHKPDNPVSHMNLGKIYQELENLDQALTSTLKSLELKPDNPAALMNLGGIYQDLGNLDQALTSTLKSLELKPDNPDALTNLGGIYIELGQLDQALVSTQKSLELKPDNPDALMNLGMIYEGNNNNEESLKYYLLSAELFYSHRKGSCITSLISSLPILIQLDRIKEAREKLIQIPHILSMAGGSICNYDSINKRHDQAYLEYLKALLPEIPLNSNAEYSESIHIGESHCLAFTNQIFSINGVNYKITPSLIKGAKAWHLGNKRENKFKNSFHKSTKAGLENYAHIFLSFGEIDCRRDEGILKYCSKSMGNIKAISQSTAKEYVGWIVNQLSRYHEKLILLGIPAPQKLKNASKINIRRLIVIRSFNEALSRECLKFGIIFADILKLTSDGYGFNNGIWMLDDHHLKPTAIQEIVTHYLIVPPSS